MKLFCKLSELITRPCALCLLISSLLVVNFPDCKRKESLSADKLNESLPVAKATTNYDHLPLVFEENNAPIDPETRFLSRSEAFNLFLKPKEVRVIFPGPEHQALVGDSHPIDYSLRLRLQGSNDNPEMIGEHSLPGFTNYFVGNDPAYWRHKARNYEKVRYREIYPGIDVVYYGNKSGLEYDFIVSPGTDYRGIALSFEGAESIEIESSGTLVLDTPVGKIRQHKPVAYQIINGLRTEVASRYLVRSSGDAVDDPHVQSESTRQVSLVTFEVGHYDLGYPLVIDPVLSYSSYLGGKTRDEAASVAVDSSGNLYVAGFTSSPDFPIKTSGGVPSDCASCATIFITKFDTAGSLVYTTRIGGRLAGWSTGVSVDPSGNPYITGFTFSNDFPVTPGAFQTNKRSSRSETDAFVTKLDAASGGIVYSTYLGGSRHNTGFAIGVDSSGSAYVTGYTLSDDFPITPNAFQSSRGVRIWYLAAAFVTKLDPQGGRLIYSTYLGGVEGTYVKCIAVDASGCAYITGYAGAGFPTTAGALQPDMKGGSDAFVTKLSSDGGSLIYSTYLGGSTGLPPDQPCPEQCPFGDRSFGIAVDVSGNAYITGRTSSSDFPTTPGSFHAELNSTSTLFLTKLNPSGDALVYSAIGIGGAAVAVDLAGNAYVAGSTLLDTLPLLRAVQGKRKGGTDCYIAMLDSTGSNLGYASYLGGTDDDFANAVAVDAYGNAYVVGSTVSENFKTRNAFQLTFGGQSGGPGSVDGDAFAAKFGVPRIISASVSGKKLFVSGENFDEGAVILIDDQKQKTVNDEQRPEFSLIGKKAGRQLVPGQSVTLRVRNSDGAISAGFIFTGVNSSSPPER